ncbi:aldo/keto reductase [Legionella brunensis]|uniref:Aldo/keto reductase n=1 Tax=Legionella brunensis TaxID=29422 RepID=A0A0W0SNV2_9GAMM|nr:aldo/keto reductase [Legionella brunensis]KTC85074.1 aldo/keto reductase [Legionella brunensis]
MQTRQLGQQGLEVSVIGLGCMGLTWAYGPTNEAESTQVLYRALDLGVNFFDTAEVYGPHTNEDLIGRALRSKTRDKFIIASKFGFTWNEQGEINGLDSSPVNIKKAIDGSLQRLGTDYIDLYYQHRLDPTVPIEDTVGAMADLVAAGKIRYIGLCEVGPATIRRAHAVHPLSVIQSEYSLWERGVEEKILPLLRELGIGFVAYSPIGRGFLTGKMTNLQQLHPSDFRQRLPRFQPENFAHNFKLVELLQKIAAAHQVTPVQIALAWLLKQMSGIVPIPGTKHIRYLEENVQSATLSLPEQAWQQVDELVTSFQFKGMRYPEANMKTIDRAE